MSVFQAGQPCLENEGRVRNAGTSYYLRIPRSPELRYPRRAPRRVSAHRTVWSEGFLERVD